MCSLDTLLPRVPGTCLQSAVANLKHSSWQKNRLFSWWTTVSWVRTMIVLLPENPGSGGRVGAERGRGLVTQPGVRHLLRGPLLLVPRIPVLEQTPLTFSKVWALLERQSLGIFPWTVLQLQNSGSDLLVQVNLHIPTSTTRCDYEAFVCFSFHRLFLFSGSEIE